TVPTLLELASLYERRHQLDEAHAVVEEALGREPQNADARLQRAILDRRRNNLDSAENDFRELAANDTCLWTVRAQAGYELAQLQDSTERYEEAWQSLIAAKRLMRPHSAAFRAQSQEMLRRNLELVQSLQKSHYEHWASLAEGDSKFRFAVLTSH